MTNNIFCQLKTIYKARFREARNSLKTLARENADFRILVVGSSFLLILLLGFFIAYRGLYHINMFPGIGPLLVDRVLYLLFFAMFAMLISSNIIIGYSTFYKSKEVEIMLTTPLEFDTVFIYKFIECMVLSSWAPLFLTTPIIIAFALVKKAPILFYALYFTGFVPFLIIAAVIGVLILIPIMRFFSVFRPKIGVLPGFVFFGALLTLWLRAPAPNRITSAEVTYLINELLRHTAFSQLPVLPNYWISKALLAVNSSDYKESIFFFLVLLSNMFMVIQIGFAIFRKTFYSSWCVSQGALSGRKTSKTTVLWRVFSGFLWFLRPSTKALVIKDIKVFKRDPSQWAQVVIFFGILGLYIINLRTLPYNIDSSFWKNMVAFLNLTATALTMAMLNIRFIFPLISLEGQRFWILGLSPITVEKLLMEKFWVSAVSSLLITEVLIITSNIMLKITGPLMAASVFTIFMMCFAVSGLAVGMSAIYPNFKSNNPARIVSGFGGTLLLVISLLYVFTVVSLEASPIYWYMTGQISGVTMLKRSLLLTSVLIFGISFFVCVIPMKMGAKALKNVEF